MPYRFTVHRMHRLPFTPSTTVLRICTISQIPPIDLTYPILERDLCLPPKFGHSTYVQQFLRGTVRFGGVKDDVAIETYSFFDENGQFLNGNVFFPTNVDQG